MIREIGGIKIGLEVKSDPEYVKNAKRCKDGELPCLICGRPVKSPRAKSVHVFYGNLVVTGEEANLIYDEEGEGGDLGYYPIGSDCLKKHPELEKYLD